jgi:MFS family permease
VCGFSQNAGEMLAFRFLAGLGACAPQTIGGGVISDLWTAEERGTAVALYTLAPILGPSVGPIIGAWITEKSTWRWSFWAVTIFGVLVQVLVYFTLEETYAPVILKRKVKKLSALSGNNLLHTQYEVANRSFKDIIRHASTRVFVMLGTQPIVQYLALYMSITYGIIYLMLSTYPRVWATIYHESVGIGGLNYISLTIGMTLGAQTAGQLMNFLYQRLTRRSPDEKGRPEFRVPLLFISTFLMSGGLFMYGWSAAKHTHWIVPNIGAAIFGFGTSMTFTSLQTYTIDTYEIYAASAVGATAVARSITGFGFPLFANYMYDALGEGWGNSVLGFGVVGVGFTGSLVLWFYGKQLRAKSQYAAEK